jgi:hypothetical protein
LSLQHKNCQLSTNLNKFWQFASGIVHGMKNNQQSSPLPTPHIKLSQISLMYSNLPFGADAHTPIGSFHPDIGTGNVKQQLNKAESLGGNMLKSIVLPGRKW